MSGTWGTGVWGEFYFNFQSARGSVMVTSPSMGSGRIILKLGGNHEDFCEYKGKRTPPTTLSAKTTSGNEVTLRFTPGEKKLILGTYCKVEVFYDGRSIATQSLDDDFFKFSLSF